VSGPRDKDARKFIDWLGAAKKMVVSTETSEGADQPGPLVLEGKISDAQTLNAGATPTATPTG
jgi:hypothetical protein